MDQVQPEQLYEAVDKIIATYAEHGKKRVNFSKFVNRYGVENLKSQLADIPFE